MSEHLMFGIAAMYVLLGSLGYWQGRTVGRWSRKKSLAWGIVPTTSFALFCCGWSARRANTLTDADEAQIWAIIMAIGTGCIAGIITIVLVISNTHPYS